MSDLWIKINRLEDMPQPESDRTSSSSYDCLVSFNGGYPCHLVWNTQHKCWDDRTGDDFKCEWDAPSHYMLWPSAPVAQPTNNGSGE